jgi:hypothetical protein
MQYSAIQYSTVQYSTVQNSALQCSTVQCSTVQCSTVQYNTVQYSAVQYNTVQYSAEQCNAVQYSAVQYNTVQYSAVEYNTVQYSAVQYSTVQNSAMQCSTVQCSTVQCSTVQYNTVQYSAVQYNTVQYSAEECNTVQYSSVKYKSAIGVLPFLSNTFQDYPIRMFSFLCGTRAQRNLKNSWTQSRRIVVNLRTELLIPLFAVSRLPTRDINLFWSLSRFQYYSAAGTIMPITNSDDTIRNRTRNPQACSALPQPTGHYAIAAGLTIVTALITCCHHLRSYNSRQLSLPTAGHTNTANP